MQGRPSRAPEERVAMAARIEWRSRGGGNDALLYVGEFGEDDNTVLRQWDADPDVLTDFLNDMSGLDTTITGLEVDPEQRDPEQWGKLVLARLPSGEVLHVDPEPYWDGIYYWFRSRGVDPHKWRGQPR